VTFTRAIVIVMDSVGIGELPDADAYGDRGSNTLGNIARAVALRVPTLRMLGLDRLVALGGAPPSNGPRAAIGRMAEASAGKDSVTGHWEMMGIVLDRAFPTFPNGFSADIISEFSGYPGEYVPTSVTGGDGTAYWSSYCLSPAALFSPKVLAAADPVLSASMGSMPGGAFKVPSFSQARFPSLKTHMCEHHWLQGNRGITCNPAFPDGTYNGCEPYYFNHAFESAPGCLFFDGSVRTMSVREAGASDNQARTGGGLGLYFRPGDPGFTESGNLVTNGYWLEAGYDFSTEGGGPNGYQTGFHILTKDGILGRDTLRNP